eukprot:TRINITY_DN60985_c0_g1_i2.p1 TRINITY_DN60985_c0_g1~~TRINITY_DN60985_c0_g1_i2.p1  ORF type:complete len:224 (-),score=47.42 TRINITY_DN60985_c0_g1_i2:71-742(-)
MSEGYEQQDATLFASWKIDMIKIDACATHEPAELLMGRWRKLLNASGRPILLSDCHNGCMSEEGRGLWESWCTLTVNMWRSSVDIRGTWESFLHNLDTLKGRGKYGGPGAWNDPDILEVGVGEFGWSEVDSEVKNDKNRAHFSMWAVTSSPLLAGNDVRNAPAAITAILTNKQAIAVNQLYAGNAGDVITFFNASAVSPSDPTGLETWVKPCLLYTSPSPRDS